VLLSQPDGAQSALHALLVGGGVAAAVVAAPGVATTLGALLAALLQLGHYVFVRVGTSVYYRPWPAFTFA